MKKIIKFLSIVFSIVLLTLSFASCDLIYSGEDKKVSDEEKRKQELLDKYGENYREELETPIDGRINGMCYIAWEMQGGANYKVSSELLSNMGCKSVRNWMHFNYIMSDYQTLIPDNCEIMHNMIQEMQSYGIFVIGMSHSNWNITSKRFEIKKPKYEDWNDKYWEWLECYETSWYTMAKEFPEITYWEIDNEINNRDFMFCEAGVEMDMETMAAIACDMMFYASRGIHRANPDNVTIMGSLVDPYGLGIATPKGNTMLKFMDILYDEIDSGAHGSYYYDDFFQTACWHPYYYRTVPDDYFWEENTKIYNVIKKREGKDKKVYLTEIGYVERLMDSEALTVQAVTELYTKAREKLPFVESIHFHRMFDNLADNGNDAGMFYDPYQDRTDKSYTTKEVMNPGSPKAMAYAFQQAAGGEGSLDLFTVYYNNKKQI